MVRPSLLGAAYQSRPIILLSTLSSAVSPGGALAAAAPPPSALGAPRRPAESGPPTAPFPRSAPAAAPALQAKKSLFSRAAGSDAKNSQAEDHVESHLNDLKGDIGEGLSLRRADLLEVGAEKKVCVLVAPFPLLSAWRKLFKSVVEKLEKAGDGQHHVVLMADRTQTGAGAWARNLKTNGVRPRSRSLKAVHEALLDDLVFPADIVSKRLLVKADGSRLLKVTLSSKEKNFLQDKVDSIQGVYAALTQKKLAIEFE